MKPIRYLNANWCKWNDNSEDEALLKSQKAEKMLRHAISIKIKKIDIVSAQSKKKRVAKSTSIGIEKSSAKGKDIAFR